MAIRRAEKAGCWYERSPEALREQVEDCIARGRELYGRTGVSPKVSDAPGTPGVKPVAVVVPHAGLFFSGSVAAVAFSLLRTAFEKIDTFVLFGACHRVLLREPALWAEGAWRTPLGDIPVDEELAWRFINAGLGLGNPVAHSGDNALELQMPFIAHMFPEAKIVPIAMSSFPDSARMGEAASRVAQESFVGKTVVAVASTDLTHYGASFGLMPAGVGDAAVEWLRANDRRFLDALVTLALDRIVPLAEREQSACGAGAAAAAAGWAHERGCVRGRVLAATNSHEVMPRGVAEHIVGYGAVAFEVRCTSF